MKTVQVESSTHRCLHVSPILGKMSSNVLTELPSHFPKPPTPLMQATVDGDAAKVAELLEGGAKVNEYTEEGFSALIYACVMGSIPIVEKLLEVGAELNPAPGKVRFTIQLHQH